MVTCALRGCHSQSKKKKLKKLKKKHFFLKKKTQNEKRKTKDENEKRKASCGFGRLWVCGCVGARACGCVRVCFFSKQTLKFFLVPGSYFSTFHQKKKHGGVFSFEFFLKNMSTKANKK